MSENQKVILTQLIIARILHNFERASSIECAEEYDDLTGENNDLRAILRELDLTIRDEIIARFK